MAAGNRDENKCRREYSEKEKSERAREKERQRRKGKEKTNHKSDIAIIHLHLLIQFFPLKCECVYVCASECTR